LSVVKFTATVSRLAGLCGRHIAALKYVLAVVVPAMVRTGRRPVIFLRRVGLGDIICSIPAAQALKRRHPGAAFIYNCNADFTAVPLFTGLADRATAFQHIGLIEHWYGFLLAGFYEFIHGDPRLGQTTVEQFCRQFGLPPTDEHPRFAPSPAMLAAARKILGRKNIGAEPFLIIHPGPSLPVKEWPREKWTELVARLRAQGFPQIIQIGVSRYFPLGGVAVAPVPGTVSFVDELSIEESLAVIALARLYMGIDSGPLHLAAMVDTPAIGIFGTTTPQLLFSKNYSRRFVVSRVECQGCGHYLADSPYTTDCPHHIRCMKEMAVEEVLRACLAELKPAAK
jgi:ADP-heptose:LPS heptosyltransferase